MQWQTVRVFISSTFSDMHAERDYLVKKVFPELSEWCEKYKLRLIDIDLRWGISATDSESKNTVLSCLKNIDKSRPFFLCFLGQRRGWVPTFDDLSRDTILNYPNISNIIGEKSITEIEIEHALLAPMYYYLHEKNTSQAEPDQAIFFFRDNPFVDVGQELPKSQRQYYTNRACDCPEYEDAQLDLLKSTIRAKCANVTSYQCRYDPLLLSRELAGKDGQPVSGRLTDFFSGNTPLHDVIISKLKESISARFPEHMLVEEHRSQQQEDQSVQERYQETIAECYIPIQKYVSMLNAYIFGEENGIALVTSPSGYGKTTMLAAYVNTLKQQGIFTIARFCGVSDLSSSVLDIWRSVCAQVDVPIHLNTKNLYDMLPDVLRSIRRKHVRVIIIDAINQARDGLTMLRQLSGSLPQGLKLILSLRRDDESESDIELSLRRKLYTHIPMDALTQDSMKRQIIKTYLDDFLKKLDEVDIDILCSAKGSENPLFLKIMLNELRVFGSFEQLSEEIQAFGDSLHSAINHLYARMESEASHFDMDADVVKRFFGLLTVAECGGLSDTEIVRCIQAAYPPIQDGALLDFTRTLLRQLRPYLLIRESRFDFLFDSFRSTALVRYQSILEECHALLSDVFHHEADPDDDRRYRSDLDRPFLALPRHLALSGQRRELIALLLNYAFVKKKIVLCGPDAFEADCDYVKPSDNAVILVKYAASMASYSCERNEGQLPFLFHLYLAKAKQPEIVAFLAQAEMDQKAFWLKTLSKKKPSGPIRIRSLGNACDGYAKYGSNVVVLASDELRIVDPYTGVVRKRKRRVGQLFQFHRGFNTLINERHILCVSGDMLFIESSPYIYAVNLINFTPEKVGKTAKNPRNGVRFKILGMAVQEGFLYCQYSENLVGVWDISLKQCVRIEAVDSNDGSESGASMAFDLLSATSNDKKRIQAYFHYNEHKLDEYKKRTILDFGDIFVVDDGVYISPENSPRLHQLLSGLYSEHYEFPDVLLPNLPESSIQSIVIPLWGYNKPFGECTFSERNQFTRAMCHNNELVFLMARKSIYIWDIATNQQLRVIPLSKADEFRACCIDEDRVIYCCEETIVILEKPYTKIYKTVDCVTHEYCKAAAANGMLFIADQNELLKVVSIETGIVVFTWNGFSTQKLASRDGVLYGEDIALELRHTENAVENPESRMSIHTAEQTSDVSFRSTYITSKLRRAKRTINWVIFTLVVLSAVVMRMNVFECLLVTSILSVSWILFILYEKSRVKGDLSLLHLLPMKTLLLLLHIALITVIVIQPNLLETNRGSIFITYLVGIPVTFIPYRDIWLRIKDSFSHSD